jgi:hypothetical protein
MDPNQLAIPELVEQLRRRMAMLPPGTPGLSREDAMEVLEALERFQRAALGRGCCRPDKPPINVP